MLGSVENWKSLSKLFSDFKFRAIYEKLTEPRSFLVKVARTKCVKNSVPWDMDDVHWNEKQLIDHSNNNIYHHSHFLYFCL